MAKSNHTKNAAKAAAETVVETAETEAEKVKVRIKYGAYIVGSKAYGRGADVDVPADEADRLVSLGTAEVVMEEKPAAEMSGESEESGAVEESVDGDIVV